MPPATAWAAGGYIAPSDRATLAPIGLGRQGMVVTMSMPARSEVQAVAACDCNRGNKE